MDKDTAIGGVILAAGVGLVAYVGYQVVKRGGLFPGLLDSIFGTGPKGGTGTVFSGIAATLFGNDIASGGVGARLGEAVANKAEIPGVQTTSPGPSGLPYNTNFTPVSPVNPTGWDPRWATGYQPASGIVSIGSWDVIRNPVADVVQVNVPVTDAAFAKIGLTTAQVEQIQMTNPTAVNGIVVALKQGTPLSASQQAIVSSVGGVSTPVTTGWIPAYSSEDFRRELLAQMGPSYDPNSGVF